MILVDLQMPSEQFGRVEFLAANAAGTMADGGLVVFEPVRLQQLWILHEHVAHVTVEFQVTLQVERVRFAQRTLDVVSLLSLGNVHQFVRLPLYVFPRVFRVFRF